MRAPICLAVAVAAIVTACAGDLLPLPDPVVDVQTPSPKALATTAPTTEPTEAPSPSPTDTVEPGTPVPSPTATAVDIDKTATPIEPSPTVGVPTGTTTPATAAPTAATPNTATPTGAPEESGASVVLGDKIDFPPAAAMIVSVGCADCEGGTAGLIRVHKGPDGELLINSLISLAGLDLPPRSVQAGDEHQETDPYMLGPPAISDDGGEIVLGVCTRGYCGPDTEKATSDAQTTVFRSKDGGVSWSNVANLDGAYQIAEVVREGFIVFGPLGSDELKPTFTVYPGGETVRPPWARGRPIPLRDRRLIWQQLSNPNALSRGDGSAFVSLALPSDVTLLDFIENPFDDQFALLWTVAQQTFLSLANSAGEITQMINFGDRMVFMGGWLTAGQLIVTADFPRDQLETPAVELYAGAMPAVLDLESGNLRPISIPFTNSEFQQGRSRIVATVRGAFARVVNTGACLNIRSEPSTDAEIVGCLADNVLLLDTGETARAGDVTWLRVVAPLGLEGWASVAYLDR